MIFKTFNNSIKELLNFKKHNKMWLTCVHFLGAAPPAPPAAPCGPPSSAPPPWSTCRASHPTSKYIQYFCRNDLFSSAGISSPSPTAPSAEGALFLYTGYFPWVSYCINSNSGFDPSTIFERIVFPACTSYWRTCINLLFLGFFSRLAKNLRSLNSMDMLTIFMFAPSN